MLHNKQWTFAAVKTERKWMLPSFIQKWLHIYRLPALLSFYQIWQAWIQRSHTSETEDPNWSENIYDLETVQKWTSIQTETKLEIQEHNFFFSNSLIKKLWSFLKNWRNPKHIVCVTCLSHKETQLSKKIFKFNTNFIQRKCEKILPYAKSNYASQIRPARLFLTQLQFTNILFSLFFF